MIIFNELRLCFIAYAIIDLTLVGDGQMAGIGRLGRTPSRMSLRNSLLGEPIPTRFRIMRALDRRFGFVKKLSTQT